MTIYNNDKQDVSKDTLRFNEARHLITCSPSTHKSWLSPESCIGGRDKSDTQIRTVPFSENLPHYEMSLHKQQSEQPRLISLEATDASSGFLLCCVCPSARR